MVSTVVDSPPRASTEPYDALPWKMGRERLGRKFYGVRRNLIVDKAWRPTKPAGQQVDHLTSELHLGAISPVHSDD